MSNEITTPAGKRGMGCFGKGCATLSGLVVFLVIALAAGTFWGLHYLRTYSGTAPVVLPVAEEASELPVEAPPPEPTLAPTEPVTAQPLAGATPVLPAPTPQRNPVASDWKAFQQAAKRGEAVMIELSAGDINSLIAGSKDAREKVFVAIDNNVGRVQVSIPLQGVYLMDGRYLNGELSVAASPDGDLGKISVSNIILNGQPVSNGFIDRSLFGFPSLRTVVAKWLTEQRIATFRIENNKAVGESNGSR